MRNVGYRMLFGATIIALFGGGMAAGWYADHHTDDHEALATEHRLREREHRDCLQAQEDCHLQFVSIEEALAGHQKRCTDAWEECHTQCLRIVAPPLWPITCPLECEHVWRDPVCTNP